MSEYEIAGEFTPIEKRDEIPWAPELPAADILKLPDLWKAVLDPNCKNKGRMIAVLFAAGSKDGWWGNNCPQEVRDKIRGMML